MTHIIYADEDAPFAGRPVPYDRQDAVRHWGRHLANLRLLEFISRESDDPAERRQAEHEIVVCQRKMGHWERHSNWDARAAAAEREKVDVIWRSARR